MTREGRPRAKRGAAVREVAKAPCIAARKPLPSLKKRGEFLALKRAPRHICDAFVLQGVIGDMKGEDCLRAGLTVTRKVGNAVERNRIKRRLRQALAEAVARSRLVELGLGGDLVVIARRAALGASFALLTGEMTKGIDRIAARSNKTGDGAAKHRF